MDDLVVHHLNRIHQLKLNKMDDVMLVKYSIEKQLKLFNMKILKSLKQRL
jgi:hypothetical protein